MARLIAVIGLGFGDCGKGLFTDALCRAGGAHAVVRFNGGAQAGHNVVLPDGRHHTFSQFASGSFLPNVLTVLAEKVVIHPTALLVEAGALTCSGIHDPLARLIIDGACRVTTPFHQAANRLRELARGDPHGTCGVGVGETVRLGLEHPELALRYQELFDSRRALDKLEAIRLNLLKDSDLVPPPHHAQGQREAQLLHDPAAGLRWFEMLRGLLRRVAPAPRERIAEVLRRDGLVILEGAQGVLLDQDVGFHPHTTWSSVIPQSAQHLADELAAGEPIYKLGVLRAYLTRHGAGPLPTHDPGLDLLAERHNASGGWQGPFRRGHPDGVLLRYACEAAGTLDGLLISHLDCFEGQRRLRWCEAYRVPADCSGDSALDACGMRVKVLPRADNGDWTSRARITRLLQAAQPQYDENPVLSPEDVVARFEQGSGLRVQYGAFGPRFLDVAQRPRSSCPVPELPW